MISIIAAVDSKWGYSKDKKIPWYCPEDLKFFSTQTKNNIVIMGAATYCSLPSSYRPLPNRKNIVLAKLNNHTNSRSITYLKNYYKWPQLAVSMVVGVITIRETLREAIEEQIITNPEKNIYLIGGFRVWEEALQADIVERIHLTRFNKDYKCTKFFPSFQNLPWSCSTEKGNNYTRYIYDRIFNK